MSSPERDLASEEVLMEIEGLQAVPPVEVPDLAAREVSMELEGRQADPPAEALQLPEPGFPMRWEIWSPFANPNPYSSES